METLPLQGKVFVRDLCDGETVDSFFLVRERNRREKRNGSAFMKLQLGDSTGIVEGVCWECSDELWSAAAPGGVVRVMGRTKSTRVMASRSRSGRCARPSPASTTCST